jgi:hypothetical protein
MGSAVRLPVCFPVRSKYVLEACGPFLRRYVEVPNGRRVKLAKRKALPADVWNGNRSVLSQTSVPPRLTHQARSQCRSARPDGVIGLPP